VSSDTQARHATPFTALLDATSPKPVSDHRGSPRKGVQTDARLLPPFERYETDTSAPRSPSPALWSPVRSSPTSLILGEIAFQRVLGDPAIAAHTGASNVFMLRVRVKDARGRGSTEARTNSEYRGARFDGGENYTNRLAAAQAAPRFKLWLECGKPTWAEFHRGLSDDAKEELKRQGKRARDREANIMAGELGGAVQRRRSIDAAAKWEPQGRGMGEVARPLRGRREANHGVRREEEEVERRRFQAHQDVLGRGRG
jgi:hypothetical protein